MKIFHEFLKCKWPPGEIEYFINLHNGFFSVFLKIPKRMIEIEKNMLVIRLQNGLIKNELIAYDYQGTKGLLLLFCLKAASSLFEYIT